MAYGDKTNCKACGREIVQIGGGHRQRQYCDDACKHVALRRRQEDKHRRQVRERWAPYTPETQVYLDWLMQRYGEELAEGVAVVLVREIAAERRRAAHYSNGTRLVDTD
jgi:hypothetical protein